MVAGLWTPLRFRRLMALKSPILENLTAFGGWGTCCPCRAPAKVLLLIP